MKLYKYSLIALALAGVMVGCSDDDYPYTPGAPSAGVYFPSTNKSTVELSSSATSVDIELARTDASEAKSYAVNVALPEGAQYADLFTIPSSVTFNAGESKAFLTVAYDPAKLEFDYSYKFTFNLNADEASAYGTTSYVCTLVLPGPWTSLGTCLYTDDFVSSFFNVDLVTYGVEIQESDITPGYYRLVNPYGAAYPYNEEGDYDTGNHYMFIDATHPDMVYIDGNFFSGMDWGYGEFIMTSLAYYEMLDGATLEQAAAAGLCGTLKDGIITFPTKSLLVAMMNYPEDGNPGLYYANNSGAFRIVLPGYSVLDQRAQLSYRGLFIEAETENAYAMASITIGADVAEAKAAIMMTDDVNDVVNAIKDGSIDTQAFGAGENQSAMFELGIPANYALGLVAYGADGSVIREDAVIVEYSAGGDSGWMSLGEGLYCDGWVLPFFEMDPMDHEWNVEVQQSMLNPQLYRVANPYSKAYDSVIVEEDLNQKNGKANIEFQILDNGTVIIMPQYSGFGNSEMMYDEIYVANQEGLAIYNEDATLEDFEDGLTLREPFRSYYDEEHGTVIVKCPAWGGSIDDFEGDVYDDFVPSIITMPGAAQSAQAAVDKIRRATSHNGVSRQTLRLSFSEVSGRGPRDMRFGLRESGLRIK